MFKEEWGNKIVQLEPGSVEGTVTAAPDSDEYSHELDTWCSDRMESEDKFTPHKVETSHCGQHHQLWSTRCSGWCNASLSGIERVGVWNDKRGTGLTADEVKALVAHITTTIPAPSKKIRLGSD